MQVDEQVGAENAGTIPEEVTTSPLVESPIPDPTLVPEPTTSPEPIPELIPTAIPAPEPMPEPVVEPTPQPVDESIPEPISELINDPAPHPEEPTAVPEVEPIPALEDTPAPEPKPVELPNPEPTVNEPAEHPEPISDVLPDPPNEAAVEPTIETPEPPKETNGIPQKVLDLTPDELDAARRLWAMQNISNVQAKSARDRTARRDALLGEMEKYIKTHAAVTLSMVAYNLNISPRKASDYLRILVHSGRIKADGQTTSRRYL